ncbi:MAG: Asp-tRNA(Asn)/Glu-tRNA(Gln) amidotransferase subunit GatC [Gammaproteobacteria bacterium]|nr:Asp-tRNA(Asn)/Glu-tRNA(Gln) amidotransferase subunit GatC [Gammaproteobacteria bacterium]MCZ6771472.1 Asp-tRNA(Asn)/Glu-tRNA(Gln) amidotransferase subunit GatC [Pseudomonadota bacterium]MCZ6893586.1 Asp-tRNA(Asn)/Glu-tRNA(Gln) amidotransferase subunit GatC [Gammaproteobacteria bacterium]
MSISTDEVKAIARLARLAIDDSAIPGYADQLSRILTFIEQMNQAETDGIEPMAHPLDLNVRLRPDRVTEKDERDLFQAQAPQIKNGLYLVPKVID